MHFASSHPARGTRAVIRAMFTGWASETTAARTCIDVLNDAAQRDSLTSSDWSQIQKLAEHLVRARRAQAGG